MIKVDNMKRNILILLAIMLMIPSYAMAKSDTDWKAYKKYGDRSEKWDAFVEAGFSAFESGNLGTAEMFFQRAIARGMNDGLVYTKIGLYFEAQGNYEKALELFKKAEILLPKQYPKHPDTKSIYEYMGRVLFVWGKIDEATPYLQKSLTNNENFMALYFLGQIYRAKAELQSAIIFFERALKAKRPEGLSIDVDILIMSELGKIYYEMKNYDVSLEWWNKIIGMEAGNQTARSYLDDIQKMKYKERERKVLEQMVN